MLGTLGSFFIAAFLSEAFLFLFSPPVLPCPRADADAGTDWSGMSLAPLSDLDGFDDDARRWCPRQGTEAAAEEATLGRTEQARAEVNALPGTGTVEATRRTEGSMVYFSDRGVSLWGRQRDGTEGGRRLRETLKRSKSGGLSL